MKSSTLIRLLVPLAAILVVMGCSSNNSTGPNSAQGELRMTLIDSPGSFDHVYIQVDRVDVHKAGADSSSGWITVNSTPRMFDLLALTNGANALLGDVVLDSGQYTQIRLAIGDSSNVVVAGVPYPLNVSSATGLKLNHEFNIVGGQLYLLTLDFNAESSIIVTGLNQYKLVPVIRVVATSVSGSISGTISPVIARPTVTTVVGADTISTAADTTTGFFKLMGLPAGSFSVSITPSDTLYRDTTITSVAVTAQQNTDLGTITLTHK